MSMDQLKAELRAQVTSAQQAASAAYHEAQKLLDVELPKWDAVAESVASDPLVAAAMTVILPTPMRLGLGAMLRALEQEPHIKEAVAAEHSAAAAAAGVGDVQAPAVDVQAAAAEPAPVDVSQPPAPSGEPVPAA